MSELQSVSEVKFVSLPQTGLGVAEAEIWAAMEPFIERRVSPDDPVWRSEVARITARTRRRYIRRRLLWWRSGVRQDQPAIKERYGSEWRARAFAHYDVANPPGTPVPWQWRESRFFARFSGGTRVHLLLLIASIERLKPRSVLEVGSGNGVNLLILACLFPDIRFVGLELTPQGVGVAREAQRERELPELLRQFSPRPVLDPTAHRRVEFLEGSVAKMPFAEGEFDLVYSSLALEQMEEVRQEAMAEIVRVCRRNTVMLEPFLERNDRGLRRLYRIGRDHFRGAIRDLPSIGLAPEIVTDDIPGRIWLQPCLVISRKRDSEPAPTATARIA